jgi:hypothetical protein
MIDTERVALAGRLKQARLNTASLQGREISKEEMAVVLTGVLGRPVHATQWQRYESGKSEAPLAIIRAAAQTSGLSPCFIAFGSVSAASAGDSEALPTEDYFPRMPSPKERAAGAKVPPLPAVAKVRPKRQGGRRRGGR